MNYYNAIRYLMPNSAFSMENPEDYTTLVWDRVNVLTVPQGGLNLGAAPTQAQCEAVEAEANTAVQAKEEDEKARTDLETIDAASVRSMREFLITKFGDDPDMPQFLKDHETDAQAARAKIIKE